MLVTQLASRKTPGNPLQWKAKQPDGGQHRGDRERPGAAEARAENDRRPGSQRCRSRSRDRARCSRIPVPRPKCRASGIMYTSSAMLPAWNRNSAAAVAASSPLRIPPLAAGRADAAGGIAVEERQHQQRDDAEGDQRHEQHAVAVHRHQPRQHHHAEAAEPELHGEQHAEHAVRRARAREHRVRDADQGAADRAVHEAQRHERPGLRHEDRRRVERHQHDERTGGEGAPAHAADDRRRRPAHRAPRRRCSASRRARRRPR